ncbi:MAG: pilus assembly protein TadD [Sphingobacteriaceae bacterium]|nr:pilus assembly protein TadD [Sphingobacteriaceae bacterium]
MTKFAKIFCSLTLIFFAACRENQPITESVKEQELLFMNHHDSANYVGIQTCRQCHEKTYQSFIRTGMGQSFDSAGIQKSAAVFNGKVIHDTFQNLNYLSFVNNKTLYIREFRKKGKDTTHSRTEKIDYIIGSGQHTNSHLYNVNGYLHQMPLTFYTQKQKWDLPPGFEHGVNTRFSRKIGLECMTCHNAFPSFVEGSENKYKAIPKGIDCERCHGPGSIHVALRKTNAPIDTSKYVDRSIVNPAKLPVNLQFDICQRCHLQGNAVLKANKSFYDYKPGMELHKFISVFIPKYENADDEFIMASHADRLKQSLCFIASSKKSSDKDFKPYKNALTCVTCHNPHISVKETGLNTFNNKCISCHLQNSEEQTELSKNHLSVLKKISFKNSDCVSCHMPISGSTDIPHVSVHDHYIRKPITSEELSKIKKFVGLFSINEKNPEQQTIALAYLQQFEKFEGESFYLDSAEKIIKQINMKDSESALPLFIHLKYLQKKNKELIEIIKNNNEEKLRTKIFIHSSLNNKDAWTCYQIGEAYHQIKDLKSSMLWFESAVKLAPYNLEFKSKLALVKAETGLDSDAITDYENILRENPKYAAVMGNLGYLKIKNGKAEEAFRLYQNGLKLDPDNETLLLNLTAYYLFVNDKIKAKVQLKKIIKINPNNKQALQVLNSLNS